jgi:hypothetical protein
MFFARFIAAVRPESPAPKILIPVITIALIRYYRLVLLLVRDILLLLQASNSMYLAVFDIDSEFIKLIMVQPESHN